MKSINIRGLETPVIESLKKTAKKEGKSVNQLVLDIIKGYLGLAKERKFTRRYHDLDHLFGKWTQDEYKRIQGKIDTERTIDRELWE